jgi:hypothetical protein
MRPEVGEKLAMVGGRMTTKLVPLVAVPAGLVTVMGPVVAPAGTVAVICVLLLTVKVAATPLKRTSVVPVKFVPVMMTEAPMRPEVGEKLAMVGGRMTTKLVLLVAVPAGLVTVMGPVVAPAGTVAVICVALLMVKAAATPLKRTSVVPVKFVPVMVTEAPMRPEVGEKLAMVGGRMTTKLVPLVAVPSGVVTVMGPVVAPAGTVAVIWVEVTTVNVALTPLKRTSVVLVKFVPVMVTEVPTGPEVGEKLTMVGGRMTTKLVPLVAVPSGVVTVMGPVVAPAGTIAVIWVEVTTVNVALTPLKRTSVVPVKFVPVMVTEVPTGPEVGEKLTMVGGRMTTKLVPLVAVPAGLVTVIGPVVAPAGTVAVICVLLLTVKAAAMPLKRTSVVPVKFVPVMMTEVPMRPEAGEKLTMVGGRMTTKLVPLVAVPAGLVTVMGPVVAPAGTVAVICVLLLTVKAAAMPLKRTSVVPAKFVPVMVTEVPTGPDAGEKLVMVGDRMTTKLVLLVAVPPGPVTLMGPVVAPTGTVAVMVSESTMLKTALTPLNRTSVTVSRFDNRESKKFSPTMVTDVPMTPDVGVKLEMMGGGN